MASVSEKPMEKTIERWGWVDRNGVQDEVFSTPDAAIAAMQKRVGDDVSMERIEEIGFRLARLAVTIRTVATLTPNDELASHPHP